MLIGDPCLFALESEMSRAYERLSFRGLGYFLIHIGSFAYGVRDNEATLLACSFDAVRQRIQARGSHQAPFVGDDACAIAEAVIDALFDDSTDTAPRLGLPVPALRDLLDKHQLVWAPDGDEAFDDGSIVVQFDVGDRVRVIGFRRGPDQRSDPSTLRSSWLQADHFYGILEQWATRFEACWSAASKSPS